MQDIALSQSNDIDHATLAQSEIAAVRAHIRSGAYAKHTAGLAPGHLQANLVILDAEYALDFARFCQRNSKSCPLVGVSDTGYPIMSTLGPDLDIRTDVPSYNVYRHGELTSKTSDITELWTERSVAFAIGCSFTFEHALLKAGVPMVHIAEDRTVPMFKTNIATIPSGSFSGGMVVSMRPVREGQLEMVTEICRRYPQAHGTPIHVGDPAAIGISDIMQPDWGTPTLVQPDQVPVFWGCGVTPQNALLNAKLPLIITHTPGCMIVTDVAEDSDPPVLQPSRAA